MPKEKIALVTGCSTGIGHITSLILARNGFAKLFSSPYKAASKHERMGCSNQEGTNTEHL